MDDLVQPFIRSYLVSKNGAREEGEPGFRAPSDADPDGAAGSLYPVFVEPREGAPAPGQRKGNEDNTEAVLSLVYTGGIPTGPLESFHRRETFDLWVRSKGPQLAKQIDNRLWKLLHDKRDWDMDGLTVIESLQWRPMQPLGNDPQGYTYIVSFIFELYAESGN